MRQITRDPLVAFLYELMRYHVPVGVLQEIIEKQELEDDEVWCLDDKELAKIAIRMCVDIHRQGPGLGEEDWDDEPDDDVDKAVMGSEFQLRHKSLVSFDLETTGIEEDERIIQIACVKANGLFEVSDTLNLFVNPQKKIHPTATKIHGHTDESVVNYPPFGEVAAQVYDFIGEADLVGFNISGYDIGILQAEFQRVGIDFDLEGRLILDAKDLFHHFHPRDLGAAVKHYCGVPLIGAHDALLDAQAALSVLEQQFRQHNELTDLASAHQLVFRDRVTLDGRLRWDDSNEIVFGFGKHRGERVVDHPKYLHWMVSDKANFRPDVKEVVRQILEGRLPKRTER